MNVFKSVHSSCYPRSMPLAQVLDQEMDRSFHSISFPSRNSDLPPQTQNKRIVVCCDGTSCTAYSGDNKPTNVARIARCIKPISSTGVPQVVHYMPGIGTGEESTWNPLNFYNLGVGRGSSTVTITSYLLCRRDERTVHPLMDATDQVSKRKS